MPVAPPLRIPLAWPLDNRNATFAKDAIRRNAVIEKAPGGTFVLKRPGTSTTVYSGTGIGQGAAYFNGSICHVSGDTFNVTGPANSATNGVNFSASLNGDWNGRELAGNCVFAGRMWIMGGLTTVANQSSDVWSTTDGVSWVANGAAPWAPRRAFSAVAWGSKMYVAGGYDGTTFYNDVWSSENGVDWKQETASAPWNPRSNIMFVAGASGLYVIGGTSAFFTANDDVWFSADGAQWVRLGGPFGWATRAAAGTCYFNNRIWIIGGLNNAGTAQNDVWSSPDGVVWTQETVAAFATARYLVGVCVYAGRMWAIGGTTGAGETADVYQSTTSGTAPWTLVTATPGFSARSSPCVQAFRTPDTVNTYRFPSIWVYGGGVVPTKSVYYGQMNTPVAGSTALTPGNAGEAFQLNSYQVATKLLFKNQTRLWIYSDGTVTRVTDRGYPATTVPGIVVLGGFVFVMDPSGLIYACALDNPFYWPALNILGADFEDDRGIGIAKYKNYLLALGETTTQLFYDAGLQFGNPLQPYLNSNSHVGCVSGYAFQELNDTVFWVSRTSQFGPQVVMLDGGAIKVISNAYVDKVLASQSNFSTMRTWVASGGGHSFFGISPNSAVNSPSLVFDLTTGEWESWTKATESPLTYSAFINNIVDGFNYVQDPSTGDLSIFQPTSYRDGATAFTVYIRTGLFDQGNKRRKFWGRLDIVGDQGSNIIAISVTDDDYQTYSTPRNVDMSIQRPALFRNGSSLRRAWVVTQTDNNPMRLEALEQTIEQGI